MPDSQPSPRPTDIIPGVAAVLTLLLLVFGLHLSYPLGIGLAVVVYAAVTLLRKPTAEEAPTPPTPADLLAEMTALSQKIAAHAVRLKITDTVAQARLLLNYLQAQPDSAAQWQDYVRDCLTSALAGTRQFAALSPYLTDPMDPAVVKFSDFLTTIAQTLSGVYEKLVGEDAANFSSQIDAYKNTLHDINQVYLGGGPP